LYLVVFEDKIDLVTLDHHCGPLLNKRSMPAGVLYGSEVPLSSMIKV